MLNSRFVSLKEIDKEREVFFFHVVVVIVEREIANTLAYIIAIMIRRFQIESRKLPRLTATKKLNIKFNSNVNTLSIIINFELYCNLFLLVVVFVVSFLNKVKSFKMFLFRFSLNSI